MNKKDVELQKQRIEARKILLAINADIAELEKLKSDIKRRGGRITQIQKQINLKKSQAVKHNKVLNKPAPKSAYNLSGSRKPRTTLATRESGMRPVQGGRVSPR